MVRSISVFLGDPAVSVCISLSGSVCRTILIWNPCVMASTTSSGVLILFKSFCKSQRACSLCNIDSLEEHNRTWSKVSSVDEQHGHFGDLLYYRWFWTLVFAKLCIYFATAIWQKCVKCLKAISWASQCTSWKVLSFHWFFFMMCEINFLRCNDWGMRVLNLLVVVDTSYKSLAP